jgi:predicted phosphate transport protein (TIGR00153 family)
MSFRLLPKDERFYGIFVEDGENLLEAVRQLQSMLTAYDHLGERVSEIQALEHRGDEIDVEIQMRLEKAFVTPFDREDIHELVSRLDDVVDGVQEVAETFVIYDIATVKEEGRQLVEILAAQAVQLVEALRKLEGFKGIAAHLQEIHDLENKADGLSRAAIGRLFREAGDPLDVIKWRDVYSRLEDTIDAAEDACEVIERMWHKAS